MLLKLCFLLAALFAVPQYDYSEFKVPNEFLNASQIEPVNYTNYLTVNLDYNLLLPMLERLNKSFGPLRSRSEAHITVISPPEFIKGLSTTLSMEDINNLALEEDLQSTPFTIHCLGCQSQYDKSLGKRSAVYNLILRADKLVDFRSKVFMEEQNSKIAKRKKRN